MTQPTLEFIPEFELSEETKAGLNQLLTRCFSNTAYGDRTYFKQLPHYRHILKMEGRIIGQLGVDYRVMNLNHQAISVFGIIDLAVHPDFHGRGFGTLLMRETERKAIVHKNNIDFLFLVTDKPVFYERLGYTRTIQKVEWLKIHRGKNAGIGNEQVTDSHLMFKAVGDKVWQDGELDMLGYWY